MPEAARATMEQQFLRAPKTPEEARAQVNDLKTRGVDGIKVVLEAGGGSQKFPRMDNTVLKAIADAARNAGLSVAAHTGSAKDVADALDAGVNSIEHGSFSEHIPSETFARMKQAGVSYDPTLTVIDAIQAMAASKVTPLERTLVEQVGPPKLLEQTRQMLSTPAFADARARIAGAPFSLEIAKQNAADAWRAGVELVTGTDAGNLLLIHGPGVHRELQLLVEAGVPPAAALQAATWNGAKLLRASNRIGQVKKGYEASMLLIDGSPLQDIAATERISAVFFKGERLNRADVLKQE